MEFGISSSAQAQAFNSFSHGFLKYNNLWTPSFFYDAYLGDTKVYPLAIIFIFLLTYILTFGSKESDTTNRIVTMIKLALIALLNYVAFTHRNDKFLES